MGIKKGNNLDVLFPFRREKGSYFEHLFAFLKVLEGIIEAENDFKPNISETSKTRLSIKKKKLTR